MSAEDGCGRCSSQRGARRLHFFHDERRRREMGAAAGGTHPAAQNTTPRTKAPRAHASVKAMGCESGPSRSAICDSPMSRGACADPRRRTSESSASTDQASRPVGDLTLERRAVPQRRLAWVHHRAGREREQWPRRRVGNARNPSTMGKGLDLDAWIAKVRPASSPPSPRVAAASAPRPATGFSSLRSAPRPGRRSPILPPSPVDPVR